MKSFNKTIELREKTFKAYVSNLWLNDKLKNIIINDDFSKNNPAYYFLYTEIFSTLFDNSLNYSEDIIEKLNIAGYFFFMSIMEVDTLIDDINPDAQKQKEKHFLPIISSICQEEGIKILTSIFPIDSVFWKYWNKRREEYLQAIIIDKKHYQNISLLEFEDLADKKSAFGKVAIDSLYILFGNKNEDLYNRVLLSHKFFSTGLQILDDIMDLEVDLENSQTNFANITLNIDLNALGIDLKKINSSNVKKYLYVYGTAEKLLNLAADYFNKAANIVSKDNLPLWVVILNRHKRDALSIISNLTAYNKIIFADTKLSKNKNSSEVSLSDSITLSKNYITKYQLDDGSWEDYCNNAGLSNVWSTGFILSHISNLSVPFDANCINKAANFLLINKQDTLWGYNTNWVSDTDSTTMVLDSLSQNGFEIEKEFSLWISNQRNDGGFSTYTDESKLMKLLEYEFDDVRGWTESHTCVSSLAYYFLCKTNPNSIQRKNLEKYLFNQLNSNGLLDSYWWTSPIYSTSFFYQGFFIDANSKITDSIKNSFSSLINLQNKNGSFNDNESMESPFYTALAISAFCSSNLIYSNYHEKIKIAVKWLIKNQYTDGSFDATYSLQIPNPNILDPKLVKEWSKSNSNTTDVIVNDFMRLFTTSAVIKALDDFQKCDKINSKL